MPHHNVQPAKFLKRYVKQDAACGLDGPTQGPGSGRATRTRQGSPVQCLDSLFE